MCGIAGELRPREEAPGHVPAQLRCMRHRGPDAEGAFVRPWAWVGQTRLSVIDLEHGDPPIENEDGTIGVALNGEIYNYRELRESLLKDGHTLSTQGDTEVIAHLAERLDPVALATQLDGMFAFAVWDDRRRRLILGRDRFGKKPLYYWHHAAGRLVFGRARSRRCSPTRTCRDSCERTRSRRTCALGTCRPLAPSSRG